MKLMLIGKGLPQETQAFVEKRCRRCIKIFNSDDFYYFFINVEEEVSPLFDVLLKCICLLLRDARHSTIVSKLVCKCNRSFQSIFSMKQRDTWEICCVVFIDFCQFQPFHKVTQHAALFQDCYCRCV